MNNFRFFKNILASWILLSGSFCVAQMVAGTVHNGTTGKLSAGDDVKLLRLDNGMQEESHTKTNGRGSFKLDLQSAGSHYMVRVFHQGVSYDRTVIANVPLDMTVFDSDSKINDIAGMLSIFQIQSDEQTVRVKEMHAIDNNSSPPKSQNKPNNFETFLPPDAEIDSVTAKSPDGKPVNISATPVQGEAGHYTVDFPLRPGETQFVLRYHLPHREKVTFRPRLPYATKSLEIMYPLSMQFLALEPGRFIFQSDPNRQGQIIREVKAGEPLSFTVSGIGTLVSSERGKTVPAPSGESAQKKSSGILWFVLAAALALLAAGLFLAWRIEAAQQQRKP